MRESRVDLHSPVVPVLGGDPHLMGARKSLSYSPAPVPELARRMPYPLFLRLKIPLFPREPAAVSTSCQLKDPQPPSPCDPAASAS